MIDSSIMPSDADFMHRCIQLARKGRGYASPNPMVGAVVVCDGKIIGEGYHRKYGEAHAEVNAIASVRDKSLLKQATIYVSLEPCSHYGKTPPCAQLIIDSGIPQVVIGSLDPFPKVAGRGVKMLEDANIDVRVGVLKEACDELNKEFITSYTKNRPYVYLKWAQSKDGYMDRVRSNTHCEPAVLSNDFTKILVHKLRANVDAIMVGTNTAILDNPSLTTRYWCGDNPTRIVLDRKLRIPALSNLLDDKVETYIITESVPPVGDLKNTKFLNIQFDSSFLDSLMEILKERGIQSVMIEGGAQFLEYIIFNKMWDEAFVEVGNIDFEEGIKAPIITGELIGENDWKTSKQLHFYSSHA